MKGEKQNMNRKNSPGTYKIAIFSALFPVIWGGVCFLILYGITPLDVSNDKWIMMGYDESDIIQHYSGWLAFRNSDWAFPIGMAKDMAVGTGTYISFTDSIPWVAILFKIVRNLLPKTFQYFGIYTLLCYVLQSVAAYKILFYKTKDLLFSSIGMAFFSFSPILMERAFRHTALGSQWLILFAIFIYIKHRDKYERRNYFGFLGLMVLAIGIHPYFLPSIGVWILLALIEDIKRRNFKAAIYFAAIMVITYGVGCLIGVLGTGISSSRDGFGVFSMNLNAILNPMSCGGYAWSTFFKTHAQILGNYDGFNYLGAGVVFGIIVLIALFLLEEDRATALSGLKRNIFVLLALLLCTMFAVSNVVTWNEKILLTIDLPQCLLEICGIFRASSRMFYPVYLCIYICLLYGVWRYAINKGIGRARNKRNGYVILAILLAIQLYDLHCCVIQKHTNMVQNSAYQEWNDEELKNIFEENRYLLIDNCDAVNQRKLAVAALKNGCKLYFSTANSGSYEETYTRGSQLIEEIRNGGDMDGCVIATQDYETAQIYSDRNIYEHSGVYIIYE